MQGRQVEQDAVALTRTPPQERERVERVPLLSGGIHTEKSPNNLSPNEVVTCRGLHMVAGRLVVDTGYVPFSHFFIGAPQFEFQALLADSSSVELLVTSALVYTYVPSVTQWQLASLNSLRATAAPAGPGAFTFSITDDSDIIVGTYVGILMDNGEQFISQVVQILAPEQIQTADALPANREVLLGAAVSVGVSLNGDPTVSQACGLLFPGNEWIIFSNGIDPIMYYFGGVVTELGGLPAGTTCAAMAVFHSMLFIGNTTEVGTHLPARVRQSDLADPEDWTPGSGGIAAIYDLLDTPDPVLNLKTLGPWLIAYRAAGVMRASFIGALNETIYWEYMSQEDGIVSQNAVADVGSSHILVGTNNVYEYSGDYTLPSIGEPVFSQFLARDGDLYAPSKQTLFTVYVPALREVWIFYPSTEVAPLPDPPTYPNKTLKYNVALKSWQDRVFEDLFISAGQYLPQETITWETAVGQWDDTIWARPWNSRINVQNVPNVFLGTPTQTQLFVYDFASTTDRQSTIEFECITRQFGSGQEYTRWEYVNFVGTGDALVWYSEDEGVTWLALGVLALGAGPTVSTQTLWADVVSTRFQLRFTGTDNGFALRYCDIVCELESDW